MPSKKNLLISLLAEEHRNLSCLTLFAVLVEKKIETELLFIPRMKEYSQIEFKKYIYEQQFAVIGLSVTTGSFFFAKAITEDIRAVLPECHVIWGGIHPTTVPEECLELADSICVGEGETALPMLIERICNQLELNDIPGIWLKGQDGKIIQTPIAHPIHDLDSLPMNKYDWEKFYILDSAGMRLFSRNDYVKYSKHNGDGYTLMTSRSCPYSCSFCINSFLNKLYAGQRKLAKRSVRNVIQELKFAINDLKSIQFVNFIDDHFLTSKDWTDEFCRVYKDEISLPFMIRATPDVITATNVEQLKYAGLVVVQVGIQTGSPTVNKEIYNRKFDRDKLVETSKILKEYKIKPIFDIIIQSEFENDADRDQTIELLGDLERPFDCSVFALTSFPGTKIADMFKQRGIIPEIDPYYNDYLNYSESDWYLKMVTVAGKISKEMFHYFLENRNEKNARSQLDKLFLNRS